MISHPVRKQPHRAAVKRPIDAADPARHILLGLLLDEPRHGYDLARAFEPGTALGAVFYLGSSHLYALLTQLERDGLIRGHREEQGARPPRRTFAITEQGRAEVLAWVDQPVPRPRDVLLDFPLKLYLSRHLGRDRALVLVERQRAQFVAYLQELERDTPEGQTGNARFRALLQEGRIARTRATLAWLDRCAETIPDAEW